MTHRHAAPRAAGCGRAGPAARDDHAQPGADRPARYADHGRHSCPRACPHVVHRLSAHRAAARAGHRPRRDRGGHRGRGVGRGRRRGHARWAATGIRCGRFPPSAEPLDGWMHSTIVYLAPEQLAQLTATAPPVVAATPRPSRRGEPASRHATPVPTEDPTAAATIAVPIALRVCYDLHANDTCDVDEGIAGVLGVWHGRRDRADSGRCDHRYDRPRPPRVADGGRRRPRRAHADRAVFSRSPHRAAHRSPPSSPS